MQRNITLDFIRGLAILGILLLNISGFGLPSAAYLNPAWNGVPSFSDALSWALLDLLAQSKFLTLFALLFGAGLQMLLPRGKRWLQARLSWLVIIGFLHAIFLWEGDILLAYGIIGLIAWRMIRDVPSTRSLFNTGVMLYLVGVGVLLLFGLISDPAPSRSWLPGAADIQYETFWKLSGGTLAIENRLDHLSSMLLALGAQYGWQLAGLMLMGGALMRNGWLQGAFSRRHYRRTAMILLPLGWLIQLPGTLLQWHLDWAFHWSAFYLQAPRDLAAPLTSLGYAALCFGFWPQLGRLKITHAVCCVGRMALTNYLLQSLICTTLFYRFGLFLHFDRVHLLLLVPLVWLANLLLSTLWLRRFRQGPLEWLWRRLTAFAAQAPMRRGQ
ncbi:DUF418 domain-containing protein YeiB [Mixta calida]|uniref:DUF418 domain-containing protein YeiB n=1 Tax=Mixta calida TaxID=665913 RepID=UPI000535EC0B|nr:hypothetical protein PSNIH2_04745 [Pantoea sp. PSNIH2]MBS6057047.1 DUF418 family protein [Pantoea sp.]POU47110.1 DUF418 family protein [Pantoea sp. PSNIH5]POU64831.1 DUF418 family protein [Pantoea sp. PSNIH4]POY67676.1 DUF418 family protein [Pantoea sp. PSNIH3]QNU42335.1 DUF418 family protein [Mixta calida]